MVITREEDSWQALLLLARALKEWFFPLGVELVDSVLGFTFVLTPLASGRQNFEPDLVNHFSYA